MSLGPLIPGKKECPREKLGDVLRGKLYLAYPVVCLRGFLMRCDMYLDPGAGQKLTIQLHVSIFIT